MSQLRLTMHPDIERDAMICTVVIPHELQCEAGPPPRKGEVGNSGIEAYWDENCPWENSVELHPEGLAMKFLRLAWLCAIDEVGDKAWEIPTP